MPAHRFSLEGKVALVTGGNAGLGRSMALALHDAGARVAIGGRRPQRNAVVQAELGEAGAAFELDVCDEASVERAVQGVVERFGRLDILVNNAGIVHRMSVMDLPLADWHRVMDTNLTGAFLCTKHAARRMKEQGGGKIVNIASVYGLVAPSRGLQMSYTVSKHGLVGLTRVNAVELAPLNIQVNAIAPGYHHTEITAELSGTPFEQYVAKRTPDGRWGDPDDVAAACVFLASAAADHVTGVCLPVDGGYMASDGLERG
jgi:2-deoxy-D-gluconate 3-dehydrogenase